MKTISFIRSGTDDKYIEIDSSEVLDAISDDQDVKIEYAIIVGDIDFNSLSNESIVSDISIKNTRIYSRSCYRTLGQICLCFLRSRSSKRRSSAARAFGPPARSPCSTWTA